MRINLDGVDCAGIFQRSGNRRQAIFGSAHDQHLRTFILAHLGSNPGRIADPAINDHQRGRCGHRRIDMCIDLHLLIDSDSGSAIK